MSHSAKARFYELVTAAIEDFMRHGFDSQARLDEWLWKLQAAARAALVPEGKIADTLRSSLGKAFKRATSTRQLARSNPGVGQFTLHNVQPRLRAELDRRILASASLIKLNREASIARTLQRFSGWATSVPIGGTDVAKRKKVKQTVRRGIAALPFEERRVIIDQGHKLTAAVNEIVAVDGGAIAGMWHHVPEGPPAYDARPQHVARDKKIYLIRGSWAHQKGFVKPLSVGYTNDITAPGEEIFCRCSFEYLYTLRDLPPAMLTVKGSAALAEAQRQILGVT